MTTTTERRVGQRWKDGIGFEYTLTRYDYNVSRWQATSNHAGTMEIPMPLDFSRLTILSDVPAAAPLAADRCKAPEWCGKDIEASREAGRPFAVGYLRETANSNSVYCSPACRDARLPPLAAQPAETKPWCASCGCGAGPCDYEHLPTCPNAKPAPAKAVQRCMWKHATTPCAGPLAERYVGMAGKRESHDWCEGHYLEYERQAYARPASGTPYTGPERLGRPKLAHVAGLHDDDLIGGAW